VRAGGEPVQDALLVIRADTARVASRRGSPSRRSTGLRGWKEGDFHELLDRGRTVPAEQGLEMLFPDAAAHAPEFGAWT
jgi:hypothetical protein